LIQLTFVVLVIVVCCLFTVGYRQ